MPATSPEESALRAAQHLAQACARIVQGPVRAVILHGSLTLADFVPGKSDIDLLVVADGRLSSAEAAALRSLIGDADLGGAGGIDLHVVASDVAASPAPAPPLELHVGRYPGSPLECESAVDAAPDLPAELSMARADGRSLIGAEPLDVLGVVDPEWIRVRGVHWLTTWQMLTDDVEYAAFMVLTACRIWRFAVEGVHCSKAAAGRWALARDGSLSVIGQALRQRAIDPTTPVDEHGIRRLLALILAEIGAADGDREGDRDRDGDA